MSNDIKKILTRYFLLMALFFIFIVMLFSLLFFRLKKSEMKVEKEENLSSIVSFLDSAEEQVKMQVDSLYDNTFFRDNFSDYLTLPTNKYVEKNISQGLTSSYIEESFLNILNNSNKLVGVTAYVDQERFFQLQKRPRVNTWLSTKNISYLLNPTQSYQDVVLYFYHDLNNLKLKVSNDSFYYVLRNMDNDLTLGDIIKENYQYEETIDYQNVRIMVYENKFNNFSTIGNIFMVSLSITLFFLIAIWISLQVVFKDYLRQYHAIMQRLKNSSSKTTDFQMIEIMGGKGDLQRIAQEINESIIKREELIKSEYQNILLKERVELSNLQHQIDPHFLFNNLEFVRMKAFLKNEYEISQFIFEVSQLYRSSVSKSGVIALEEELSMINSYLNIYKARGEGSFQFSIKNNVKILDIPKFSLQPFAENYIKYGIRHTGKNYLSIKCIETERAYHFSFADNGNGATEATISEIYQKIAENNHLDKSIGIANAIKRLKLFYKMEVDYQVKNIPNRGFLVKITIHKPSKDKKGEEVLLKE